MGGLELASPRAFSILQPYRLPFGRSGAADPDGADRLLLLDPLRSPAVMGERLGQQDRLFYEFCLDDIVPLDHLLRRIDSVLGRFCGPTASGPLW